MTFASDDRPGIRRVQRRGQASYVDSHGRVVRDGHTLSRIRALVIPPAWTDVWISPHANGHLQATGRDARGRKQYRYHNRWREFRDAAKYAGLIAFAKSLPRIRRRVDRDLRRPGLSRAKVLAAVVRLLETSLIRIGNEEYARENHSFGLTTMQDRHAAIRGGKLHFHFRGKSGVVHEVDMTSPRLAQVVRRCQELPGQELFQYRDEHGRVRDIGSADVNGYLREAAGRDVSAKDFRTWAGTALAAKALEEFEEFDSQARAKRNVTRAIERVAARLGNTATVCRKCYVHPAVIDSYMDRTLLDNLRRRAEGELRKGLSSLRPEEAAVLALLERRMRHEMHRPGAKVASTAAKSKPKHRDRRMAAGRGQKK
ncbi:MAG TPA: hypothetical protein VG433_16550 [Pirellulales bacterium]|nr:hypothetical protein [Pirellulales bacterium]